MNKGELVKTISEKATKKTGLQVSQSVANACLTAALDTIQERTKKREDVVLVGFGTFSTADRAAKVGRNPRSKEVLQIPAKVVPTFKAGTCLKAATSSLKVRAKKKSK